MPSQIPLRAPESEVMGWAMWSAQQGHAVAVLARDIQEQKTFYTDAVQHGEHVIESCGQFSGAKMINLWGGGTLTIFVMQAARGSMYDIVLRPWSTP